MSQNQASSSVVSTIEIKKNEDEKEEVYRYWLRKKSKKNVRWRPGIIDNEFLNKKKSKKCCIYHKKRAFDESDSDDSDSEQYKNKDNKQIQQ